MQDCNCRRGQSQSVELPSKVPALCNSTNWRDVGSNPGPPALGHRKNKLLPLNLAFNIVIKCADVEWSK